MKKRLPSRPLPFLFFPGAPENEKERFFFFNFSSLLPPFRPDDSGKCRFFFFSLPSPSPFLLLLYSWLIDGNKRRHSSFSLLPSQTTRSTGRIERLLPLSLFSPSLSYSRLNGYPAVHVIVVVGRGNGVMRRIRNSFLFLLLFSPPSGTVLS